jgi:hypothetical protein
VTDTLPRARLHAAALAVAARTDDGARAALLDYLAESDDPELRDRAELARLEGELAGRTEDWPDARKEIRHRVMTGELSHASAAILLATADTRPDPLAARIAALQSRLSAWPCPECGGHGLSNPSGLHGGFDTCRTCRHTGDVLKHRDCDIGPGPHPWYDLRLPLAWDCGYPRWVTLPTVADAVRSSCPRCSATPDPGDGEWITCRCGYAVPRRLIPTPRLRALAAVPPWGVPLEGVRVGDRRARRHPTIGYCWSALGGHAEYHIPDCLFRHIVGEVKTDEGGEFVNFRFYPTEAAAQDALARGIIAFAREYQ